MRASTTALVLQRAAVAAGLAVVAGLIVVPLLAKCKCIGPQGRSLNDAKQLTLAVLQYAQDYDGRFPGWVRNPDGRYAHNAWDQQIHGQIKSKDVFRMEQDGRGIRSYSDPEHQRVLSYGMNALLFSRAARFDGHADLSGPPDGPLRPQDVRDPARTILLAEISTREAMPAPYGEKPDPVPYTFGNPRAANARDWQHARDGWIDISPRDFVENTPAPGCYRPSRWNANSGVTRAAYKVPGGSYGFVDGHVKFLRPLQTVSDGSVPPTRYWAADNTDNLWNPRVARPGGPVSE